MNLQALKQKHKELGEEIARLEKGGRWRPEKDMGYFVLDEDCDVRERTNATVETMMRAYSTRNVFRTKEEAEQARKDKLEFYAVLDELERISGWFVADWSDDRQFKYRLFIDHQTAKWATEYNTRYQYSNWPVFPTRELAQKAIDTLGKRLDVLLKVV